MVAPRSYFPSVPRVAHEAPHSRRPLWFRYCAPQQLVGAGFGRSIKTDTTYPATLTAGPYAYDSIQAKPPPFRAGLIIRTLGNVA